MANHKYFLILLLFTGYNSTAQELFVFTEPASNMAKGNVGVRAGNSLMKERSTGKINYHLVPEVMIGISKKIMVHGQVFISNRNKALSTEGGSLYLKYRFLSNDEVHSHFRMAAFGRYSFNNSDIHQPAIDLMGHNSGYEAGLVSTKLMDKVAISAGASFLHAIDNGDQKFVYGAVNSNAINYSLSFGKLMLPKEYTSYRQLNLNLMAEFLGQVNSHTGTGYLDIAPSVQFIINSRMRVDAAYRIPLSTNLYRTSPSGTVLKLEYNFFNVLK